MAEKRTLARPYASAAFDVARDAGRLGDWAHALGVAATVAADPEALAAFAAPKLGPGRRAELVVDVVRAADADAGALLGDGAGLNFVKLLAENGRLAILPEIARLFDELRADEENTVDVEVVSAVELDDAIRERLTAALAKRLGRDVRLHCAVDDDLLGGAIIRANDLVIDGSIRTRLGKLADALTR